MEARAVPEEPGGKRLRLICMGSMRTYGILALSVLLTGCLSSSFESTQRGFDLDCSIPSSQLYSGQVPDGIPALTHPRLLSAVDAPRAYDDDDRVLGVVINGAARAYPLLILWWHEIVNDTLGGEPVLVTYCPLTGSGLAFDPRIRGRVRNFGVSGLLYENNLVMFDRLSGGGTESLWNQLLMGAQCGAEKGTELRRVPVVETTWARWRELYPETSVLSKATGHTRNYGAYPYGNYDEPDNPTLLFPSSPWNPARPPKELVLGVRSGSASAAYPFGVLDTTAASIAVNDTVGGRPILVTFHHPSRTSRAYFRELDGQVLEFDLLDPDNFTLKDRQTGSTWNELGAATAGPLAGKRLESVTDSWTMFWFAWSIFYPQTRIYR